MNKKEQSIEDFEQLLIQARNKVFTDAQKIIQQEAIEAHVFGSVARGDSDAYSDLDIWFTFKDEDIEQILKKRLEYYSQVGEIIHICEPPQNSPVNGMHSFVLYKTSAGLLQVDYYLCPQSTSFQTKDSKNIFGNIDLPTNELVFNTQKVSVGSNYRVDFLIIFVFIAIKNLARKKAGALGDLLREYGYLSERDAIKIKPLENRADTFDILWQIISNIKEVSNNKQMQALSEIELFSHKVCFWG